ncbi:hypothetical protein [Spiroplasma endosymbiont of Atherix ibis]|uniref:hypothetical protein n=1 Tax=Spiroplasma endosymbiont of Atherix ibis TaxID=3066291 RepID=UPI0030CEFE47
MLLFKTIFLYRAVFNLDTDDEQIKLLNTIKCLKKINKNFKSTGNYLKKELISIEEVKELEKIW